MRKITTILIESAFILFLFIVVLPIEQVCGIVVKGYNDAWLEYSDEIVTVKFKNDTESQEINDISLKYSSSVIPDSLMDTLFPDFKKMEVPTELSREEFIKVLLPEDNVEYATPLCFMEDREYILTNEFVVKFNPGVTEQEIEDFNSQYPINVIRKQLNADVGYRYRLELLPDAELNAVELSNLYYDADIVNHADPDLGPLHQVTGVKAKSRLAITWGAIKRSR